MSGTEVRDSKSQSQMALGSQGTAGRPEEHKAKRKEKGRGFFEIEKRAKKKIKSEQENGQCYYLLLRATWERGTVVLEESGTLMKALPGQRPTHPLSRGHS